MNKLSHPRGRILTGRMPSSLPRGLLEHHGGPPDCSARDCLAPRPGWSAVAGINEGLTLMESLLVRQGKTCGHRRSRPDRDLPHPEQAAAEGDPYPESYPEDVDSLEQAERSPQSFDAVLQRLEIAPETS